MIGARLCQQYPGEEVRGWASVWGPWSKAKPGPLLCKTQDGQGRGTYDPCALNTHSLPTPASTLPRSMVGEEAAVGSALPEWARLGHPHSYSLPDTDTWSGDPGSLPCNPSSQRQCESHSKLAQAVGSPP